MNNSTPVKKDDREKEKRTLEKNKGKFNSGHFKRKDVTWNEASKKDLYYIPLCVVAKWIEFDVVLMYKEPKKIQTKKWERKFVFVQVDRNLIKLPVLVMCIVLHIVKFLHSLRLTYFLVREFTDRSHLRVKNKEFYEGELVILPEYKFGVKSKKCQQLM